MKRILKAVRTIPYYFDKYWWSDIQESDFYFCNKNGNILIPEDCFAYNPVRHFFMCCRYDLKHWDECDSENSIFENNNYDLVEVNKVCRKYGVETSYAVQVYTNGKLVQYYDESAKKDKWYKKNLKRQKNSTEKKTYIAGDSPEVIDSELVLGDFIKNYGKND